MEDDPSSDDDVEISLHTFTGIVTADTMHLPVSIATKQLRALVDSGSTHSFVVSTTAHRLSLELEPCPDLTVSITNGDHISCNHRRAYDETVHMTIGERMMRPCQGNQHSPLVVIIDSR